MPPNTDGASAVALCTIGRSGQKSSSIPDILFNYDLFQSNLFVINLINFSAFLMNEIFFNYNKLNFVPQFILFSLSF
jgi:hypothetical protein